MSAVLTVSERMVLMGAVELVTAEENLGTEPDSVYRVEEAMSAVG